MFPCSVTYLMWTGSDCTSHWFLRVCVWLDKRLYISAHLSELFNQPLIWCCSGELMFWEQKRTFECSWCFRTSATHWKFVQQNAPVSNCTDGVIFQAYIFSWIIPIWTCLYKMHLQTPQMGTWLRRRNQWECPYPWTWYTRRPWIVEGRKVVTCHLNGLYKCSFNFPFRRSEYVGSLVKSHCHFNPCDCGCGYTTASLLILRVSYLVELLALRSRPA
jgi:hypothetical protein